MARSKPTNLRATALALLEITEADLNVPRIEHMFKGIGGKTRVLEYLAGSEEPEAREIVKLHERLTKTQAAAIPFEAYCVAAKIPTKKMFGIVAAEVADQGDKAMRLLVKGSKEAIMGAAIKMAKNPLGEADRKMIMQAEGYAPVPRTSITNIHGGIDARNQTQNVALLPSAEENVKRLSDRFNAAIVVTPAIVAPEAEPIEEEAEPAWN